MWTSCWSASWNRSDYEKTWIRNVAKRNLLRRPARMDPGLRSPLSWASLETFYKRCVFKIIGPNHARISSYFEITIAYLVANQLIHPYAHIFLVQWGLLCCFLLILFNPKTFISIVISKIDYLDHIPYFSTPFHGNERKRYIFFQKVVPVKKNLWLKGIFYYLVSNRYLYIFSFFVCLTNRNLFFFFWICYRQRARRSGKLDFLVELTLQDLFPLFLWYVNTGGVLYTS